MIAKQPPTQSHTHSLAVPCGAAGAGTDLSPILARLSDEHEAATRRLCRAVVTAAGASEVLSAVPRSEAQVRLLETMQDLVGINRKLALPPGATLAHGGASWVQVCHATGCVDLTFPALYLRADGDEDRPPSPDPDTIKAIKLRQLRIDADLETLETESHSAATTRAADVSALEAELEEATQGACQAPRRLPRHLLPSLPDVAYRFFYPPSPPELLHLKKSARVEQEALESRTSAVHEEVKDAHDSRYEALDAELTKAAADADEEAVACVSVV